MSLYTMIHGLDTMIYILLYECWSWWNIKPLTLFKLYACRSWWNIVPPLFYSWKHTGSIPSCMVDHVVFCLPWAGRHGISVITMDPCLFSPPNFVRIQAQTCTNTTSYQTFILSKVDGIWSGPSPSHGPDLQFWSTWMHRECSCRRIIVLRRHSVILSDKY